MAIRAASEVISSQAVVLVAEISALVLDRGMV